MAGSSPDRVGGALELLRAGLAPFVEKEMVGVYGDKWNPGGGTERGGTRRSEQRDIAFLLGVIKQEWDAVFSKTLRKTERNLVFELHETRNEWAHQKRFDARDVSRAVESAHRLLESVGAVQAEALERLRHDLLLELLERIGAPKPCRASDAPSRTEGPHEVSGSALTEIESALDRYREAVGAAGLSEKTEATYTRHAETFVRWLRGDFAPGCRVSKL